MSDTVIICLIIIAICTVAIAVTTAISGLSAHNLKKYREQYKNYLENQNDCRK